ncbi:unnamed protein product [Paramecium octaurelia]|uniref:Uncharacterized protein n=1 Tax=Paramecium octaurelia TaxID=43137 RepID=A0A8S1U3Q5_PAROT|nr:unnamed protein product [Paramecium octaurelia]
MIEDQGEDFSQSGLNSIRLQVCLEQQNQLLSLNILTLLCNILQQTNLVIEMLALFQTLAIPVIIFNSS